METQPPIPELFERYLRILGITKKEPSRDALTELVSAQIKRVPFENISKLYYRKRVGLGYMPGFELFLDGIEHYNFGGTCYTNNYYFYLLLVYLGYEIKLCGADMANPDVHMVSIVEVGGREFLIDVGYGAPFLAPLPRDLEDDYEVSLGRDRYVLKPRDADGRSRIELYRNDRKKHGYTVKPIPRRIDFFSQVISDSFTNDATFMNALLLVRYFSNRSVMIHNLVFIRSEGTESFIRPLASCEELAKVVEENFDMPRAIVAEAVEGLGQLRDAWD